MGSNLTKSQQILISITITCLFLLPVHFITASPFVMKLFRDTHPITLVAATGGEHQITTIQAKRKRSLGIEFVAVISKAECLSYVRFGCFGTQLKAMGSLDFFGVCFGPFPNTH
ncbi:hypothetical protein BaRGS_00016131 [Batillaria attramentaria]|uniref:Uncharacterized protein n=1 Tax=Batillaria attramentaria TaxID=370345 RepID=A0ABD0KZQ7_9CAEN